MTEDRRLWDAVSTLKSDVAVMRGDVGHLREDMAAIATLARDQGSRISRLERWKYTATGVVLAAGWLVEHWQILVTK